MIHRSYLENGETLEDDNNGYASGSSNYRDRTNHHSKRREKVVGDDTLRERIQEKHGMFIERLENDWDFC